MHFFCYLIHFLLLLSFSIICLLGAIKNNKILSHVSNFFIFSFRLWMLKIFFMCVSSTIWSTKIHLFLFHFIPIEAQYTISRHSWLFKYHNKNFVWKLLSKTIKSLMNQRIKFLLILLASKYWNFFIYFYIRMYKMIWYNTNRKFISYSKQLNLGSTLLSFSKQYSPRTKICTQQNTFYKRLPNYTTLMDGSYSLYMQFVSYKFQLPMILFNGFFIFMHGLFSLDWIIPRMGLGREIELRVFNTQNISRRCKNLQFKTFSATPLINHFLFLIDKSRTLKSISDIKTRNVLIWLKKYFVNSIFNHDRYATQKICTFLFEVFVIHCFSEPQIIGHFPVITLPVFVQHKKKLSFLHIII